MLTLWFSSAAEAFPFDVQEAEENFDLALIGALEIDVVPHLGDSRVSDSLVSQLAKVLHQGSRLYESEASSGGTSRSHSPTGSVNGTSRSSRDFVKLETPSAYSLGSTTSGSLVPRERFSYWCFDLLFLICSNITKGNSMNLTPPSMPKLTTCCP